MTTKKRRTKKTEDVSPELEHEVNAREKVSEDKLVPKTAAQGLYLESIRSSIITFGIGPAGTGKTYLATSQAAQAFKDREISRIIVTRPAVEAGEELGFLPGSLEEKFDPYFRPVRAVLEAKLGRSQVEYLIKRKAIEALPLAYMRGHTFDNSFVLFDEAQNASIVQMKLLLTRIGNHSRVVVNGDIKQKDIYDAKGLEDAIARLGRVKGVSVVQFGKEDIVRSGIAQKIVEAYET
jgi:phosphate starvation-inducible protein PhoH and related proteins